MNGRFRLACFGAVVVAGLAGCGEIGGSIPPTYSRSASMADKLKGKPKLQARVTQLVANLFGPAPDQMRVPPGAPLSQGGALLSPNLRIAGEGGLTLQKTAVEETVDPGSHTATQHRIRGGYAIYRQHCLHCHGMSGDGEGPTAAYLWPPPRNYLLGVFKFTSTTGSGPDSKPTRDDLRRTIRNGIGNSSMPAFAPLLTTGEIEQVIDYVLFLSMRGEIEGGLVYLSQDSDDADAESELGTEQVQEVSQLVFDRWRDAETNVIEPKTPRNTATADSIARGRRLFLGEKGLQCYGCHGLDGKGNGESFVDFRTFVEYVFPSDGHPGPEKIEALKLAAEKANKKWGDDWGDALRPANLTLGVYKGGRRPLDLYWRVAKGINGTPMPVHLGSQLTSDQEVWDLVNFVMALPYDAKLLEGAKPVEGAKLTTGLSRPSSVESLSHRNGSLFRDGAHQVTARANQ